MPEDTFSYGPLKQRILDIYWQAEDLMKSEKRLSNPQEAQDFCWLHGFIFALMLVCDGQAEDDLPPVLDYTEKQIAEYVESAEQAEKRHYPRTNGTG